MLGYLLKRLILLPARLFAVTLVIFGVLNLGATPPSQEGGGDNGQRQGAESSTEAFRQFKRSFHLDKPVFLNTRFLTRTEEVRAWLRIDGGLDPAATPSQRVDTRERLDDYGQQLVPHLVALLEDPDPEIERLGIARLPQAAERPLLPDDPADRAAVAAQNVEIVTANAALKGWGWPADPADAPEIVAHWESWGATHLSTYTRTPAGNLADLLLDTRFAWYWCKLLALDLGTSNLNHRPIIDEIASRIPTSLTLATLSLCLAWGLSLPIGLYSAWRPHSRSDATITIVVFLLYSLPLFFTGTVALGLLATGPHRILPSGGFMSNDSDQLTALAHLGDVATHLVLPVSIYAAASLAALSRYTRAGVIEVMRADYVRTARAKGLSEGVVVLKHAARNGLLPILTLLGAQLPVLVSGSVVIETIFNIPGMGLYLYQSINQSDYDAVMGVLLVAAALTLVGLFFSDIAYAIADPRIRHEA